MQSETPKYSHSLDFSSSVSLFLPSLSLYLSSVFLFCFSDCLSLPSLVFPCLFSPLFLSLVPLPSPSLFFLSLIFCQPLSSPSSVSLSAPSVPLFLLASPFPFTPSPCSSTVSQQKRSLLQTSVSVSVFPLLILSPDLLTTLSLFENLPTDILPFL